MLTVTEYLWFVEDCLEAMTEILEGLGDDLANRRLQVEGANSPYGILSHCLGVMEYWGGDMVAGRRTERDRDAEFVASGPVGQMRDRVRRARERFAEDVGRLRADAPPAKPPAPHDAHLPFGRSQGAVLMHVFHELAQHLGQMEVTRDVLTAEAQASPP